VPAALERSRSGEGGHVWIFFSHPIPARDARQLGAVLLTETMERRPQLGFTSYDRLFPSQDTVPKGGFGNLIALPLQRRARDYGNSVFVDHNLNAYRDQWAFLDSLGRLTPVDVYSLIGAAEARDRVLAVRMPVADENGDEPWNLPPSRRHSLQRITEPLHKVRVRDTVFTLPPELEGTPMSMPAIYSALGRDEARNAAIFDDVGILSNDFNRHRRWAHSFCCPLRRDTRATNLRTIPETAAVPRVAHPCSMERRRLLDSFR
jgi:hypothetical protein